MARKGGGSRHGSGTFFTRVLSIRYTWGRREGGGGGKRERILSSGDTVRRETGATVIRDVSQGGIDDDDDDDDDISNVHAWERSMPDLFHS